ncbi:MAG: Bax inhibitor-1/YccA family protein [Actinomycetota bacterium]|nr:Bax inhibitor-1/YccA family protein [Actinomycetota bacterium]MDQ3679701.1 Bax inhibitor-1/YccA family protein [Actinomycetota bacterium]
MANPALNEKTFAPSRVRTLDPTAVFGGAGAPPRGRMTLEGVISRSAMLFPILLVTAWLGWNSVERTELGVRLPGWLLPAALVGLGVAVLTIFKPKFSPYTAPAYAAVEGLVVGAISAMYNFQFDGIVLQAVMLTGAVFAIMLGLYATRLVRVTDRLRKAVMVATLAVMAVYLVSIVMRLFGADVPMIHENGPVGILFSLAVVGIASFNLLLDFDLIETGVAAGAPKWMEWYAAFALLVTLVWLYLELLRLLSKLRSR